MTKSKKLPEWYDLYPHGTKEGDEELKFFISLARNPKYQWRSTSAIAKETGLSKERVEEIIAKYHKKGMVFQNPKNDEQWAYFGRVPDMVPDTKKSISGKDQNDRINKDVSHDMIDLKDAGLQIKSHGHVVMDMKDDGWIPLRTGEKRVFYIDLANVSTAKAEQFMNSLQNIFKAKRKTTEKVTGVPVPPKNGGEMDDAEYFRRKLFEGLNLPGTK